MFPNIRKDITGAVDAVGNAVSTGAHDVANDFTSVVHGIGNAIGGGTNVQQQQSQAQQAAPAVRVQQQPNPAQQQTAQPQGFQPTLPVATHSNSQLPTSPQSTPLGGIKVGPSNADVNSNLKAQQQNVQAVKVNQDSGFLNGLKHLGSDVSQGVGAVASGTANAVNNFLVKPAEQAAVKSYNTVAPATLGSFDLGKGIVAAATNNPAAEQNAIQAGNKALTVSKNSFATQNAVNNGGTAIIKPILSGGTTLAPYAIGGPLSKVFDHVGAGVAGYVAPNLANDAIVKAALGYGFKNPALDFMSHVAGGALTGGTINSTANAAQTAVNGGTLPDIAKSWAEGLGTGVLAGGLAGGTVGSGDVINSARDNLTPLNEGGYAKFPYLEPGESEVDPFSVEYAQGAKPDDMVKQTADSMYQHDKTVKGGNMQPDGQGGYIRTTEHSPFYSQYFAENGRAPSKAAYTEEVTNQMEAGGGQLVAPDEASAYQIAKERELSNRQLSVTDNPDAPTMQAQPQAPLPRSQQTGIALDRPSVTPEEQSLRNNGPTAKILKRQQYVNSVAAEYGGLSDAEKADLPAKEQMALHEAENPTARPPLSKTERAELIKNDPNQQTKAQVKLQAKGLQPAIAETQGHVDEVHSLFSKADHEASKLSKSDKAILSDALNGEDVGRPMNPDQFSKVTDLYNRAYDTGLATDRAAGGQTLRYGNGKYSPLSFKADDRLAKEMNIPDENLIKKNGRTIGYRYQGREYRSYMDAVSKSNGKLQPLYKDATEDAQHYSGGLEASLRKNLLDKQLQRLYPDEYHPDSNVKEINGTKLSPTAKGNLPGAASDRINKALKNYQKSWEPSSTGGKVALNAAEKVNALSKGVQFFGTPFHYVNETESFIGKNLLNPKNAAIGVGRMVKAATTQDGFDSLIESARERGTLPEIRAMGVELHDGSKLERATSAYALTQAENELRKGVDPYSDVGRARGASINKLVGRKNDAVEGVNPNMTKLIRGAADAPRWTPSQLGLIKDALNPLAYRTAEGRTQARFGAQAVVGKRIVGAGVGIGASAAIANHEHRKQSLQDIRNEAGLTLNNPVPNIQIGSKNNKGERQELALPTDQAGLAVGLATNPSHFAQSRYSPGLSFGAKLITNKNWNDQPLSDASKPLSQQIGTRVKNAAINSFVPIGVQNLSNLQKSVNNPNIAQGIGQDFGLRLKTNPNDPQIAANNAYFKQQTQYGKDIQSGNFKAIDPALAGMDKQYAADWSAKWKSYQDLSPGKDMNGVSNSSAWNALGSGQKDSYLLMNDPKTGAQTLSPIFYIQQHEAQATPSRPHSPLYDQTGNDGVGFTLDSNGNVTGTTSQPRAQVALNYQQQPSNQKSLTLAANPWLSGYEQQVGNYASNYKPTMTQYMQSEGYTTTAINQYWQAHPNNPTPLQSAITPNQQNLMNQYENITDPTAKSQFFNDNAKELSTAFTAAAIYSGKADVAKGDLPNQMYPNPTPEIATQLAQMQSNPNHDKAISKANALLIKNNPALNQYLADVGIYNLAKDVGRYQYQDPAHPGMTAASLLNLGRPIDQSTLKSVVDVGKYDIAKDAGGQYQFMGAGGNTGGFGAGYSSGGGSGGSSKKNPMVAMPKIKKVYKSRAVRGPRMRRAKTRVHVAGAYHATHGSISIQHGSKVAKPVKVGA